MNHDERMKKLQEIHASVPERWRKELMLEIKVTPGMESDAKNVLKHAHKNWEKMDEKLRQKIDRLRYIYESGQLSKTKTVLNEKIAQKIDKFVERKIKYYIKRGWLPDPKDIQDDEFIKSLNLKYAQQERVAGETN